MTIGKMLGGVKPNLNPPCKISYGICQINVPAIKKFNRNIIRITGIILMAITAFWSVLPLFPPECSVCGCNKAPLALIYWIEWPIVMVLIVILMSPLTGSLFLHVLAET